jgi:hypothetical protein
LGAQEQWRTILSLGAAVVGLVFLLISRRRAAWVCLIWLMLPLLVLSLVQPKHGVAGRYLIFLQPIYLMLVASGVVWIGAAVFSLIEHVAVQNKTHARGNLERRQGVNLAVFGVGLLFLAVIVIPPLQALYGRAKLNDWRAIANYIEQNSAPGALIYGERNTPNMNALTYYLPNLLRYDTPPTTIESMQGALNDRRQMWYVSAGDFFDPEGEEWARENLGVVPNNAWQDASLDYQPRDDFRFTQSEHLATLYVRAGELPSEIVYRGRQGFSNENTEQLRLNPGETLEAQLRAADGDADVLEIELASKKPAQFDVLIDGNLVEQVREDESEKGARTLAVNLSGQSVILARVTNRNPDFPMFLRRLGVK